MAHFAKLGANSKVIQVLTMDNDKMLNADGVEDESVGQQWLETHNNWPAQMWIQTSYNTSGNTHNSGDNSKAFRGNYAGIGYEWDEDRDAFIEPKPKNEGSWVLDETTCRWKRPVDNPGDSNGLNYTWDEDAYQADNTAGWVSSANNQVSDGS